MKQPDEHAVLRQELRWQAKFKHLEGMYFSLVHSIDDHSRRPEACVNEARMHLEDHRRHPWKEGHGEPDECKVCGIPIEQYTYYCDEHSNHPCGHCGKPCWRAWVFCDTCRCVGRPNNHPCMNLSTDGLCVECIAQQAMGYQRGYDDGKVAACGVCCSGFFAIGSPERSGYFDGWAVARTELGGERE